jgi:hypothetical protein
VSRGFWKKRKTNEDDDTSIPEIKHPSLNLLQRKQSTASSDNSFTILVITVDLIDRTAPKFFFDDLFVG